MYFPIVYPVSSHGADASDEAVQEGSIYGRDGQVLCQMSIKYSQEIYESVDCWEESERFSDFPASTDNGLTTKIFCEF